MGRGKGGRAGGKGREGRRVSREGDGGYSSSGCSSLSGSVRVEGLSRREERGGKEG